MELISRHQFLEQMHQIYRPRSYLEVGVYKGASLALSRVPSIAIDPGFRILNEIQCDVRLIRKTSDDFFAQEDPLAHLPNGTIDLGFIDGMHLFEFALRDFINIERFSTWASVIAIDDVLPRNVAEASREQGEMIAWAGDVFKIAEVLQQHRPDLLTLLVDTSPTGLLLVFGADPHNSTLSDLYEKLVDEHVRPDPQVVPTSILSRTGVVEPRALLEGGFWSELADARDSGAGREVWLATLRAAVESAMRPIEPRDVTPDMLQPKPSPVRQPVSAKQPAAKPKAAARKSAVPKPEMRKPGTLAKQHTLAQHAASSLRREIQSLRRRAAKRRPSRHHG